MVRRILASICIVLLVGVGITFAVRRNDNSADSSAKLRVAASYYPLYEFARQVGKDKITATNMTPAGAEPHDYEPSARTLADARRAPVFIYNGGHMEPWTDGFLQGYQYTAVKAGAGVTLLVGRDPHFWLDPVLAERIVDNVRDGLSKADPANSAYYARNAEEYKKQLRVLDTDFRDGLGHCRLHTVISSHQAFSYLGRRYNVHIVPIAGLDPEAEPSAGKLAELSAIVKKEHIGYIFFESLVSPKLATTIASETGAKTIVFDPIEGLSSENQKQGKDYLSLQRDNLRNLRLALACQ